MKQYFFRTLLLTPLSVASCKPNVKSDESAAKAIINPNNVRVHVADRIYEAGEILQIQVDIVANKTIQKITAALMRNHPTGHADSVVGSKVNLAPDGQRKSVSLRLRLPTHYNTEFPYELELQFGSSTVVGESLNFPVIVKDLSGKWRAPQERPFYVGNMQNQVIRINHDHKQSSDNTVPFVRTAPQVVPTANAISINVKIEGESSADLDAAILSKFSLVAMGDDGNCVRRGSSFNLNCTISIPLDQSMFRGTKPPFRVKVKATDRAGNRYRSEIPYQPAFAAPAEFIKILSQHKQVSENAVVFSVKIATQVKKVTAKVELDQVRTFPASCRWDRCLVKIPLPLVVPSIDSTINFRLSPNGNYRHHQLVVFRDIASIPGVSVSEGSGANIKVH